MPLRSCGRDIQSSPTESSAACLSGPTPAAFVFIQLLQESAISRVRTSPSLLPFGLYPLQSDQSSSHVFPLPREPWGRSPTPARNPEHRAVRERSIVLLCLRVWRVKIAVLAPRSLPDTNGRCSFDSASRASRNQIHKPSRRAFVRKSRGESAQDRCGGSLGEESELFRSDTDEAEHNRLLLKLLHIVEGSVSRLILPGARTPKSKSGSSATTRLRRHSPAS